MSFNCLVLDIENSPLIQATWSIWQPMSNIESMMDVGHMLCWSAKWLGTPDPVDFRRAGDRDFLSELHRYLNEADAVLTYNGRKHDLPMINREFLKANIPPPSPYKHIDLFETAKKQFKFPSNKMAHLLKELGLGEKTQHEGLPLWLKCLAGNEDAWKLMKEYNINDVVVLERLYYKLQPWIISHVNRNLFSDTIVCPVCGSKHLQQRGWYKSQTGLFKRLRCNDCGHWSRTRYTELTKEQRKNVVVSAT